MYNRESDQEPYQPRKLRERHLQNRLKKKRRKKILQIVRSTFLSVLGLFLAFVIFLLGKSFVNFVQTGEFRYSWVYSEVDIMLDAGHGGKDEGASHNGVLEKDINLEITKMVRDILTEKGYRIGMIRDDDTFVDVHERADRANKRNARIFVSIHCNSSEEPANGIETFYAVSKEESSLELTEYIQNHLIKNTGARDRGVKTEDYAVILETDMPAALAEVGFLNDNDECALLQAEDYQRKLAEGIAAGILEYLQAHQITAE